MKIFVLVLGCLFVLSTSFCVHQNNSRNVSSTELNKMFVDVEPLVRTSSKNHKLFVYEKMHNTRSASILVEYQCENQEVISWESFKIERFLGISEIIDKSIVRLRYIPLSLLDFSNKSSKPTDAEVESTLALDKIYDLSLACKSK